MFKQLHIWWLKRRARHYVMTINALYDHFDCGSDLIDMITGGRLSRLKNDLAVIKCTLKRIDPNFLGNKL